MIENNGTAVTQRSTLNLPAGSGLVATDNLITFKTELTVDSSVVRTNNVQTIAGAKTFSAALALDNTFTQSVGVPAAGGSAVSLTQSTADAATGTRTALRLLTNGTSAANDYLIQGSNGVTSNVFLVNQAGGLTATAVNAGSGTIQTTGALSASGQVTFGGLNAAGIVHTNASGVLSTSQIVGSDLASNIAIATTGSIATTGAGTVTSAGLLTASGGLTLSAGNFTQSGAGAFSTGTGAVSLNGATTVANGSTFAVGTSANTLTTQNAASVFTGNGLTTGRALAVDTGTSAFSTGAGAGFACTASCGTPTAAFSGLDTATGAVGLRSTGNFTGTLFALTADQTTAGTVLGISANKLTTGRAVDVQLGALYSGTGAINVRAEAYSGTIFNVTSNSAATAPGANLANISSPQIDGRLLNVVASGAYSGAGAVNIAATTATVGTVTKISGNALTTGTLLDLSATALASGGKALNITVGAGGSAIAVNTAVGYAGNLVDLQVNGAAKLRIDQSGAITGPAAGAFSIDNGSAAAMNVGTTNATTLTLGRSGQTQALGGNVTIAGTLTGPSAGVFTIDGGNASAINLGGTTATDINIGRTGQTQALLGNVTIGGTLRGPTATAFSIDSRGANAIDIGAALATAVNISRAGMPTSVKGTLDVVGDLSVATTKLTVAAASGNLTSQGAGQFGSTAVGNNQVSLAGAATGSAPTISALGSDANVGLSLVPKGTGRIAITANGLDVTGTATATTSFTAGQATGNQLAIVGAATGTAPSLMASGVDLNVGIQLAPKGTGRVEVTANGLDVRGSIVGPSVASTVFTIDNGNASAINIGGATATALNLGRTGQTQALLGNVTVAGTLTGPTATTFTIDSGGANAISIGGTSATTLNLGRTGQTQALLGNQTVAGTSTVTGLATLNGGLTVAAGTARFGGTGAVHIVSSDGTVPTLTAGAGVGTGSCAMVANASDTVGQITITVVGTPGAGLMCTLTYSVAYAQVQSVQLSAANAATASTSVFARMYVGSTNTTFTISSAAGIPSGTYSVMYLVIGR